MAVIGYAKSQVSKVTVYMDKPVDPVQGADLAGAFSVAFNGKSHTPTEATVDGRAVSLTMDVSIPANTGFQVVYTEGPLVDAASPGNRVTGFFYASAGR